jgi:hypothetical protein
VRGEEFVRVLAVIARSYESVNGEGRGCGEGSGEGWHVEESAQRSEGGVARRVRRPRKVWR